MSKLIYKSYSLKNFPDMHQATTTRPIYDERRVNNTCINTGYELRKIASTPKQTRFDIMLMSD